MTATMLEDEQVGADATAISLTVWTPLARHAVEEVAKTVDTLTTDEVWDYLAKKGIPTPAEPKSMGPVMLSSVRRGVIRPTDRTRNSTMPQNHRRPQRLYESLINGDAVAANWLDAAPIPEGARCPTVGCPEYNIKLEDSISSDVRLGSCPRHGRFAVGFGS